jgi:hypothetical protein
LGIIFLVLFGSVQGIRRLTSEGQSHTGSDAVLHPVRRAFGNFAKYYIFLCFYISKKLGEIFILPTNYRMKMDDFTILCFCGIIYKQE